MVNLTCNLTWKKTLLFFPHANTPYNMLDCLRVFVYRGVCECVLWSYI